MNKITLLSTFLLLINISCDNENDFKSHEYEWVNSNELPYFGAIHRMKVADGESLYISGNIDGVIGIYRLQNNKWIKLVETSEIGYAEAFSVYNGVLYYGNNYGLFRVVNSKTEKLRSEARVVAMEVYEGKLLITGPVLIENNYYALVSFDGSTFSRVSEHHAGYAMNVVLDKLYISNYPVIEYGDNEVQYLNDFEGQTNIAHDKNGALYISGYGEDSSTSVVKKYSNGKSTVLGDTLNGYIRNVNVFNNAIIVTGFSDSNGSICYMYENNNWKEIAMSEALGDVVLFDNKLIGSSLKSGKSLELQLK